MYEVVIKRKILRELKRLPELIQKRLVNLLEDLRDKGPIRSDWPNYSKLGSEDYHCHLTHRWVACWSCVRGSKRIEVYYAGSREKAPY